MSKAAPIPLNDPLVVVKVGGDILADKQQCDGLVANVAAASSKGWRVIVLHGGGPQISAQQKRFGISANKVGGRRITTEQDLQLVKQVICGELNVDLVAALQAASVNAFGCNGVSGKLISAVKRPPRVVSGSHGEAIDFGEVGDVTTVNIELINQLLAAKLVPVIASLATDGNGHVFNINADTTVVNIAKAMNADLLLMVSRVGAIFENLDNPDTRIANLSATQAAQYIEEGVIQEGMIPKVEEALQLITESPTEVLVANLLQQDALLEIGAGSDRLGTRFTR